MWEIAGQPITVIARVKPGLVDQLDALLTCIGASIDQQQLIQFGNLKSLHFVAWLIIANDPEFPPDLVMEATYDGDEKAFFDMLLKYGAAGLDAIYSHCEDYPSRGSQDESAVKEYLSARVEPSAAVFVGIPGLTVESILSAVSVRKKVDTFIDGAYANGELRGLPNEEVVSWVANSVKRGLVPDVRVSPITLAAQKRTAAINQGLLLAFLVVTGIILVPLLVVYLIAIRLLELKEGKDEIRPPTWSDLRLFDRQNSVQNHLATVLRVKAGRTRKNTLRGVLWVVNGLTKKLMLTTQTPRVSATVHFARWLFIDKGQRLLFLTNFDGTWEGYLGEFGDRLTRLILTAIWSNTEGFPPSKFLFFGGAKDVDAFKRSAREHGVFAPLWYRAYPDETILNLRRDMQIRDIVAGAPSQPQALAELL